ILGDSGIIDSFCFGCETGNLGDLLPIVNILSNEPPEFRASLRKHLDSGLSFAQSRSAALGEINSEYSKIIRKPNNILAVEYLIAQQNLAPHLNPIAIPRKLLEHHSLEFMENFATSSGIRASIDNDITKLAQFMSPPGFAALLEAKQKVGINRLDNFSHILHHIFATKPKNDIAKIAEITEGMENRLIAKAARHFLISDIINAAATKRYPRTAISRGVLHILLGITKAEMARFASPEYIRVLGFRRESADLIGELSRKSALPIVTNLKNSHKLPAGATKILAREIYFSNLYQLGLRSANFPQKSEFPAPIIV
ncbi:MAG: nucleotidyltransferase family protein, partial [Defluviitaleaceae bacterium]|nr:nucleotidyltransferase family protein [Defluviitaleaceae bacterium]